ncbi:hypothetical protein DF3PB_370008 [uncultured Defluviicoccus sp.]|uniref:Uncharacterized protein n=1 Tax=metagenome TaxID=256318 RepID=A0A380THC8_9ZZZZ|nr:hypothetical protein DF3PB_370008 [uncultured Defluviicoccus sp.]
MQPLEPGTRGAAREEQERTCSRLRRPSITHVVNAPRGRPCHDRITGAVGDWGTPAPEHKGWSGRFEGRGTPETALASMGKCSRLRFGTADFGVNR